MFEFLYNFFAIVFGYIMNVFYMALDFIGLPYLWLCIVLFAAATRLIFLPQRIGAERKALLAPTINYEMNKLRKQYGSIKKTEKERLFQYKNDTKAIFKKYKVSSGTGCLNSLIQFPILVGLFRVIKAPFEYVPALARLSDAEKLVVNDFFGLSLESLPQSFGVLGIIVPAIVMISSLVPLVQMFLNKKKKQPVLIVSRVLVIILLTWMSFCFPIAISLYWVVNSVANLVLNKTVKDVMKNNKKIKAVTEETLRLIEMDKATAEEEKAQAASEDAGVQVYEQAISEECIDNLKNNINNSEPINTPPEIKEDTPFFVDEATGFFTTKPDASDVVKEA